MPPTRVGDRGPARLAAAIGALLLAASTSNVACGDDINETFIDARGGLMVADSRNTPGQTEGTFATLAYGVDGGVRALRGKHVFAGSFHVLEGISMTLVRPDAVKGVDDARGAATYEFHIAPIISFAAWARVEAPFFGSRTIRGVPTDFYITRADGYFERKSGPSLDLTQPFAPLIVDEGVGLSLHPLRRELLWIDMAAGMGGEHAFASGQLAVVDDPHTREVEVLQLESYHALTPLVAFALGGHIGTRAAYAADVEVRFPVVHTDTRATRDVSIIDLTEIAARHTLELELVPWLTVDYELSIGMKPLLVEGLRLENRLMLSAHPFTPPH